MFVPPPPPALITEPPAVEREHDDRERCTPLTSTHIAFGPPRPPEYLWLDLADYEDPSEEKFERMAEERPETLCKLLQVHVLRPSDLTFAAEAAGKIADAELVVGPLLLLLKHPSPLVREGAVYGLVHHLSQEVIDRLQEVAKADPSPGVREAASEALEPW